MTESVAVYKPDILRNSYVLFNTMKTLPLFEPTPRSRVLVYIFQKYIGQFGDFSERNHIQ
jgi:hypothetical protein